MPRPSRSVCDPEVMSERIGGDSPSKGRIVAVAVLGGLAVTAGVVTPVGRIALAVGAVSLALVIGIGFAVKSRIARKYPPVIFDRQEPFKATAMIESARSRLAAGDSAAFVIHPGIDDSGDAVGQIWLFAAQEGVLDRVAIELALPDSSSLPSGLDSLLRGGWEIQESQLQEWVILTRSDGIEIEELVVGVVDGLTALFDVPRGSNWSCQALA